MNFKKSSALPISCLVCSLALSIVFAGCRSAPVRMTTVQEGQWRAKALIKDREQNRSYIVNLNFNAQRGHASRMDVSTTLGMGVASLVVGKNEVNYILLDSKKYYSGAPQPGAMRPILAIPFDPRWLENILFDVPFTDASWTCSQDKDGFLSACNNADLALKITWSARSGDRRTILMEHDKASVQLNIQSFRPKVEERKNLFALEAPDGFQKLRVR